MELKVSATHMMLFLLFSMIIFSSFGSIKGENQNQEKSRPAAPCVETMNGKNYTCLEGKPLPQGNHTGNGNYPRGAPPTVRQSNLRGCAATYYCGGRKASPSP